MAINFLNKGSSSSKGYELSSLCNKVIGASQSVNGTYTLNPNCTYIFFAKGIGGGNIDTMGTAWIIKTDKNSMTTNCFYREGAQVIYLRTNGLDLTYYTRAGAWYIISLTVIPNDFYNTFDNIINAGNTINLNLDAQSNYLLLTRSNNQTSNLEMTFLSSGTKSSNTARYTRFITQYSNYIGSASQTYEITPSATNGWEFSVKNNTSNTISYKLIKL